MIPTGHDSLNTRSTLKVGSRTFAYYSLAKAAEALGECSGAEVGERLGEPEGDDEGEHGRAGGQAEVLAPDEGQR